MTAGVATQQAAKFQPGAPQAGWAQIGRELAQGLVTYLKPTLVAAVKQQVCDFVEKGEFEKSADARPGGVSLSKLQQRAHDQDIHFEGIEYIKQDGGVALIGLKFTGHKSAAKSFLIELKMRRLDGYWQVSKWNNAYEVLKQFGVGLT